MPRRHRAIHREARRLRQRTIRRRVVAAAVDVTRHGRRWFQVAQQFHLHPRTLRRWRCTVCDSSNAGRPVGRPLTPSSPAQRNDVLRYLQEHGPGVSLSVLRAVFVPLARAELEEILRRYRRWWRRRHHRPIHVLEWTRPGAVWAIDFAVAPAPIDGATRNILAVRDLASGHQLLWQSIRDAAAPDVALALAGLFRVHGPPLVLKSDNGSAFGAAPVATLLARCGVLPLFSPPHTPCYNGAIEAGIGSLKTRTYEHAARHGRPGHWTADDLAAAQLEANATARPRGPHGPTPDDAWEQRRPLHSDERGAFLSTVDRERRVARGERGLALNQTLDVMTERALDRVAIRRALVEHGVLLFSRRRIPPPIPTQKADTIM